MPSRIGRFSWVDLSSADPTAAITFYTQVVGWSVTPFDTGDGGSYPMWTGASPVGGLVPLPPHVRAPNWLPYVSTADIEATTARVKELGGHVLQPPTAIAGGAGWFAVFRDPQGAAFAAHQGDGSSPIYDGPPRPGDTAWHELATTDFRAASVFYAALFDWELGDVFDLGNGSLYQLVQLGGANFAGIFDQSSPDAVPAWLVYFSVADVRAAVNRVRALGGTLVSGPMEVPTGDLVAQCVDPQGARFALHQVGTT